MAVSAVFAVSTVWAPALSDLSGYGWIIGAVLGAILHMILAKKN
jgi:NCS1 family nucleobase:cation symporter-1